MGAAAKVDLAQTIRDAAKSIKKARDKIDKIDDKIKAQQTLLDLARQLDAAEAKAATAQEQAQAAAAEEVEHAQAAEQEPDDVKQKGHRKALRDAQRRRSAREREAADLTAKVADLADAVINFDPEQPSRPSRSKAPVKGPKLGTSSLIAIGAAMAVYLAFRKP
jgi:chromosome segregation ATPase